MTLPPSYGWYPVGERLCVPYEAPQGRRVNAIGAYFSHGYEAGRFLFETYASLPKSKAKTRKKTVAEQAHAHGLAVDEVGPIDAARLLAFVWKVADRPAVHRDGWKRSRPLYIVLDNYSVHKSQDVKDAVPELEEAGIHLFFLPSYSPEMSRIEPIWNDVKHHRMPTRSFEEVKDLKAAVDQTLARKAEDLMSIRQESRNLLPLAA